MGSQNRGKTVLYTDCPQPKSMIQLASEKCLRVDNFLKLDSYLSEVLKTLRAYHKGNGFFVRLFKSDSFISCGREQELSPLPPPTSMHRQNQTWGFVTQPMHCRRFKA